VKRAGHVAVCGLNLPVKLGTEEDFAGLKGAYGCFDPDTGTIWLDENIPPHVKPFWTVHEVLHAVLLHSGALYVTASIFGCEREDPRLDRWEEAIVRILTPHLLETWGKVTVS
jgi:hypothetical protein